MLLWFLEDELAARIAKAYEAGQVPTAQEQADYEARILADSADGLRVLSVAGNQASIQVLGVLTGAPNLMAKWFGGGNTTYAEIRNAVASAEANPAVKTIHLQVSSPGGEASAEWLATMDAIAAAKKPVYAEIGSLAASAAYGIVSQADEITAQNKMSRIGSVGVVSSVYKDSGMIHVTSTEAPDKRPDASTKEGAAVIRAELDQMHDIFASSVAAGRGVTVETVNAKFGRGAMMLAEDAVKRGMIDAVGTNAQPAKDRISTAANSGTEGGHKMDLNELKEKHPSVFAQAVAEGVAQGVTGERDRVTAHLTMGRATNSLDVALSAIEKGEAMTATHTAKYMAATVNQQDTKNRVNEDAAAAAALAATTNANNQTQAAKDEEALAQAVADSLGVDLE